MKYKDHLKLNTHEYEIVSHAPIGLGAYGEIWEARRLTDDVHVAVKTIRKKYDDDNPYSSRLLKKGNQDLKKEIQLLKKIPDAKNKFIMPLLDHGLIDDEPVMVLPLADKRKLSQIYQNIHNNKIEYTLDELLMWFKQIATALHTLHNQLDEKGKPYVHRDLKFNNILFLENNAYLCDFGSTKRIKKIHTSSFAFTEEWTAPELIFPNKLSSSKNKKIVEYKIHQFADIYSLGLMFQAMITGEPLRCQNFLKAHEDTSSSTKTDKQNCLIDSFNEDELIRFRVMCNDLFQNACRSEVNETIKPFSNYSLPIIDLLIFKILHLVLWMLSLKPEDRPNAKIVISSITEIQNYLYPEINSISFIPPKKKIYINQTFEIDIIIDGKGLIKDDYDKHYFPLELNWLCVCVGDFVADKVSYKGTQTWSASFNGINERGIYSVTAMTYIYGKEFSCKPQTIEISATATQLWEKGDYVEALLQSKDNKQLEEWINFIQKDSYSKKSRKIIWLNILEKVRKENKNIGYVNEIFWHLNNSSVLLIKKSSFDQFYKTISLLSFIALFFVIILYFTTKQARNYSTNADPPPPMSFEQLKLRSIPAKISEEDIKNTFRQLIFFDDTWFKHGNYKNDFIDNEDATITDLSNGLTWQQSGSEKPLNYDNAKKYIQSLNEKKFAGHNDWRLPTIEELISLIENEKMNEDLYISPLFNKKQRYCWSSDIFMSSGLHCCVLFYKGCVDPLFDIGELYYVRSVRYDLFEQEDNYLYMMKKEK